jgi:hypothetical protein
MERIPASERPGPYRPAVSSPEASQTPAARAYPSVRARQASGEGACGGICRLYGSSSTSLQYMIPVYSGISRSAVKIPLA